MTDTIRIDAEVQLHIHDHEKYPEGTNPEDHYGEDSYDYSEFVPKLILNGVESDHTINDYALVKSAAKRHVDAWIITCGCGSAGCAGIWDAIKVKVRKHTVEWRVPKNQGYGDLKSFYSFNKKDYIEAIDTFVNDVKDIVKDDPLVYDQFTHGSGGEWHLISYQLERGHYDRTVSDPTEFYF